MTERMLHHKHGRAATESMGGRGVAQPMWRNRICIPVCLNVRITTSHKPLRVSDPRWTRNTCLSSGAKFRKIWSACHVARPTRTVRVCSPFPESVNCPPSLRSWQSRHRRPASSQTRSPSKWMRCVGESAHHISVSQEIVNRYLAIVVRSGSAVTYADQRQLFFWSTTIKIL